MRAPRPASPRPSLPRNVWILGFVSLLMDLSSEIYHALLPAFVTVVLGPPATALGAIDGIAEATANFAKLGSGRLSDRSRKRKPLILAGYGLAALTKPLFALATGGADADGGALPRPHRQGHPGRPRDAMIADETPAEIRGRAFGLRQSLDTVGALLAPLAAIGLMAWFASDIRMVFWIAMIPAVASFAARLDRPARARAASRPRQAPAAVRRLPRPDARHQAPARSRFPVRARPLFRGFLILKGMEVGLSAALSPLTLVLFNLVFGLLAFPAGALSDRVSPRAILIAGMALLVAGNLILAASRRLLRASALGVALWGAHMALTQGIFARMIADAAPAELARHQLRRVLVRQRDRDPAREPRRRLAVGPRRQQRGLPRQRGVAAVALAMLSLLPKETRSS